MKKSGWVFAVCLSLSSPSFAAKSCVRQIIDDVIRFWWGGEETVYVPSATPNPGSFVPQSEGMPSVPMSAQPETLPSAPVKQAKSRLALMKDSVSSHIQQGTRRGQTMREMLQLSFLGSVKSRSGVVSLAIENPEGLAPLIQRLVKKEFTILYDADAPSAALIRQLAGRYSIGIASSGKSTERVLVFENPYLRLQALLTYDRLIVSPDSLVGLGLRFQATYNYFVWDPSRRHRFSLSKWSRSVHGLNLNKYENPSLLEEAEDFRETSHPMRADKVFDFDPVAAVEYADASRIEELLKTSWIIAAGEHALQNKDGKPLAGGAVVFGSSMYDTPYTQAVYSLGRQLALNSIPVATGGSGGLMEAANAGAFDAGGESIGIPITGGFKLSGEKHVARNNHTLTIETNKYDSRIPLLTFRRPLIINAPGGSGTMKEVAVSFLLLAEKRPARPHIAFFDRGYYEELVANIRKLPLSPYALSHIHLTDPSDGIGGLLATLDQDTEIAPGALRMPNPPVARNENTSFIRPKSEYTWSKSEGRGRSDDDWLF